MRDKEEDLFAAQVTQLEAKKIAAAIKWIWAAPLWFSEIRRHSQFVFAYSHNPAELRMWPARPFMHVIEPHEWQFMALEFV